MSGDDIVERLRYEAWHNPSEGDTADAHYLAADALAEIERLRQWKAEATTVIGDWQAVFDSLVAPRVSQFDFGKSTSVLTVKEIVRLSSEVERLRAENERLETARKQLLDAARGYMDMVVEERNNNERLRAEVKRLRRPTLLPSAHELLTDEIVRLRAAGDALAEALAWWGKGNDAGDAALAAWQEARHEQ